MLRVALRRVRGRPPRSSQDAVCPSPCVLRRAAVMVATLGLTPGSAFVSGRRAGYAEAPARSRARQHRHRRQAWLIGLQVAGDICVADLRTGEGSILSTGRGRRRWA